LVRLLLRFVVLPRWAAETLALWTLHTHAFQLRHVTTYLGIESPEKRCGKTTLLTVQSELVNRPIVAANISSPAFFRAIEELRPTLLIDEADTLLGANDELRGILNSGYTRKTAFVLRVTPAPVSHSPPLSHPMGEGPGVRASAIPQSELTQHATRITDPGITDSAPRSTLHAPHSSLARFSSWCPKAIAAIGRLPDTLADRCIIIRMQRKTSHETCERLRNLDATTLRRQCARFVLDHHQAIADATPDLPPGLNDRAADIWEPLLALADLAGAHWPALARQAALGLTASSQDHSPIGSLLLDILFLFVRGSADRIFSRDLVEGLSWFTDHPWAQMVKGKKITELWLSQRLRPYGIRPKTIWIGETQAKGYLQDDLAEAFRRYIPKSELEALKAELIETDASRPQPPPTPTHPPSVP
jgi:putative DNA primase/helicase